MSIHCKHAASMYISRIVLVGSRISSSYLCHIICHMKRRCNVSQKKVGQSIAYMRPLRSSPARLAHTIFTLHISPMGLDAKISCTASIYPHVLFEATTERTAQRKSKRSVGVSPINLGHVLSCPSHCIQRVAAGVYCGAASQTEV